ncbi:MAG: hypothetical protein QCI38_05120 [Candidatus Thermoplasmatota archaeon]|nr:hypothetical protein [Candidatus Thermoplasmatota archaeon]
MIRIGKKKEADRMAVITSRMEMEIDLMQRHVEMLKAIIENEPIGIIRLAELLNYPQHKVRYSLRLLEQDGLIEPSPEGAMSTKRVHVFLAKLKEAMVSMEKTIKSIEGMLEQAKEEARAKKK